MYVCATSVSSESLFTAGGKSCMDDHDLNQIKLTAYMYILAENLTISLCTVLVHVAKFSVYC